MKIKQISVVLENASGRLFELTKLLYGAKVDIRSLWVSAVSEFGVVHLVVDKPLPAFEMLKSRGYSVKMVEVFALKADDRPGGLMKILEILKKHDLNVEYVYGFGEKHENKAVFVFRISEIEKALEVLEAGHLDFVPTEHVEGRQPSSPWEFIDDL